jgi:hypothetical protein
VSVLAPAYRPRRPQDTVLHRVVREHLETFLEHAAESYEAPLPKYVRDELRGYLRCGIFEHGFLRARCDSCGHDLLVAFSCKARGVCRVIPSVPVRQWVLSLPFDVRARAAFDASVLTAIVRVFANALRKRHYAWAKSIGLDTVEFGAITFVQRFGSSLNLNVHLHVVVVDGVFSRDEHGVSFTPAPPPTKAEMGSMARAICTRVDKALRRHVTTVERQAALERCAQLALFRGDVRKLDDSLAAGDDEPDPPVSGGAAVDYEGFNLEASVRIDAADDFGREHLLRYCARPSLALGRLSRLPGGKLAYRIKKLRGGKSKMRILTPLELLARY